jgi:hypothetical protein
MKTIDSHNMTRELLAHALGIPAKTLKTHPDFRGMPRKKNGRKVTYDYWEVTAWLREQDKRASEAFKEWGGLERLEREQPGARYE